ncbi:MAG: hypothetical protein MUF24_02545 [Chitinophagaceae bacterium]|jgi:ABC-type oligopeptide transport system ATPase subunit|nr:hypothetical protein [Chitinophagaceae bacterium]
MRVLFLCFALTAIYCLQTQAQVFNPVGKPIEGRFNNFLRENYAAYEKVPLNDPKNKVFFAKDQENYIILFVYQVANAATRKFRVVKLDEKGALGQAYYTKNPLALSNGQVQIFGITLKAEKAGDNDLLRYKIEANKTANVYLYRVTLKTGSPL